MADKPKTEVAPVKATPVAMPGSWRDHLKTVVTQAADMEKPTGGFISFRAGRLSIGDQTMPGDKIECVIVDSVLHNKYFDTPYNANKVVPPKCYAFARETENLAPTEECEDKQSEDCLGCPQNEWGSSGTGTRGKACTNSRRLWLLPADVVNSPDKIAKVSFLQCDLPVTSVINFSKFVTDLASSGLPPFAVIAEISVKVHPTSLFQVHFKSLEQIKDERILEALTKRNWMKVQEPLPVYPSEEEMAGRSGQTSTKY